VAPVRFRFIYGQQRALPIAGILLLTGAILGQATWFRVASAVLAATVVVALVVLRRAGAELILDDDGYALREFGREKVRVPWREVVKVRFDAAEQAMYLDCGDPARNLLIPPARGYGYRFERPAELCDEVKKHVPADKIEAVEKL
jgi:hypothetical protein